MRIYLAGPLFSEAEMAFNSQLAAQLEALRDTGQSFRIWGELRAGLMDANATQIVVTDIELVD